MHSVVNICSERGGGGGGGGREDGLTTYLRCQPWLFDHNGCQLL